MAYGSISAAKPGLIYGLKYEVETKLVGSGGEFAFGDPVFVDQADEDTAYPGDSTDVSLAFLGVAIITQKSTIDEAGGYAEYESMNVLTRGRVWVTVPDVITDIANMPAYVIVDQTDPDYGKFTSVSLGNYPTGGYFRTNPNAGHLAVVELNGLNAGVLGAVTVP